MSPRTKGVARRGATKRKASPRSLEAVRGRVRAHDPFELIRWLAFSQPDPRKALAELVQNSLDAGARNIRVARVREKGVACLRILDDGEGVIPEMERAEALQYIATHIGHSRKRSLSPQERFRLMTQGQYGIGLLGFWSLGDMLEIRTALPRQRAHKLILYRDQPDFLVEPLRGRLPLDETWTEVVVLGLHKAAMSALGGRRAADYLAAELRGQLLSRDVDLVIEDRVARGRAQKIFSVRPPRFLGERLRGLGAVEVPGYPPVQLEIYLSAEHNGEQGAHGIGVYAAGTLVANGFHELAALGLDREPWTDPRLSGMVDFPGFRVAPGSRRGIVADEGAEAFAEALRGVETALSGILDHLERKREDELDRNLIRDLQRAFRDFYRQRPRYELLPIHRDSDPPGASNGDGSASSAGAAGEASAVAAAGAQVDIETPSPSTGELLPPGPLDSVCISPNPVRVAVGGNRHVHARALDDAGRPIGEGVLYEWTLEGDVGILHNDARGRAGYVRLQGSESLANGSVRVVARSAGRERSAEAQVEVSEEFGGRANEGIPEPEFVSSPGSAWRSRMHAGRWQVNTAHPEYRDCADRPALKLRYLAMLFAKEVVVRSHQDPRLDEPLEQLVEVAGYADRNLTTKRSSRMTKRVKDKG